MLFESLLGSDARLQQPIEKDGIFLFAEQFKKRFKKLRKRVPDIDFLFVSNWRGKDGRGREQMIIFMLVFLNESQPVHKRSPKI